MKSFCISLEKNRHKWNQILDGIKNAGFEDVEIFNAINGNEIGKMYRGEKCIEENNAQTLLNQL